MNKTKILVVDDDDSWLQTIELILDDRYDLHLTTKPAEALTIARSTFFSLAILDQQLKGHNMSGVDLFGQLRNIRQDLRAIILTGYAELDDAVGSMRTIGISDYISKGRTDLATELQNRVERALAEDPREKELLSLIHKGESAELEFKSSARWDLREKRVSKDLGGVVVRSVAAFLNSEAGGTLLLGVDDTGRPIGLQHDYQSLKKQDRDGFQSFLLNLLLGAFGKDVGPFVAIDFQAVNGNDVCRVCAKPAPRPIFVRDGTGGEHFFLRTGNSTRQLEIRDALEYCRRRWK